jgi:hypothetical protein
VAAVVFALFYDTGDAIVGISTGILAPSAQVGALGEQAAVAAIEALFADPLKTLLFDIGRYAWIVALILAAVALWRAGAPRLPLVLLALPAYLVTFDHAFPSGSLTLGSFCLARTRVRKAHFSWATSPRELNFGEHVY